MALEECYTDPYVMPEGEVKKEPVPGPREVGVTLLPSSLRLVQGQKADDDLVEFYELVHCVCSRNTCSSKGR